MLDPFHTSSHSTGARDVLPCLHKASLKLKTKKCPIENRSEEKTD